MNSFICIVAAVSLLLLFTAVNLFLPFALVLFGGLVAVGSACRYLGGARGGHCTLGRC